jgi:phage nucleotide-binding protein
MVIYTYLYQNRNEKRKELKMKVTSTKDHGVDKIKMLIYGPAGSGKTSLARTLPNHERCLIVSAEAGLLSISDTDIDLIDITTDDDGNAVAKTDRIKRLGEVFTFLATGEAKSKYDWVFIDSLTELSDALIDQLNAEYPDKKDSLVMYGENSKRMKALVKSFRDMPHYNVVFTALPAVDKDQDGVRFTTIQMVGKIAEKLPAMFDEVFYLHVDSDGQRGLVTSTPSDSKMPAKDRSGKLEKLEKADLAYIASKIKGEL